ncbi:hypothetical protein AB0K68_14325 [Streptomyces sp. NPDC050698]
MTGRQFRDTRGDTFTDVVAPHPDARPLTREPLSSGSAHHAGTVERLRAEERPDFSCAALDPHAHLAAPADGTMTGTGGSHSADVVTGDRLLIENPGGTGYGPPSPDPHQAGEEIDDLRAF